MNQFRNKDFAMRYRASRQTEKKLNRSMDSKAFDKELVKNVNKQRLSFYESDKNYKKAKKLVEKYSMIKWNELARDNERAIAQLKKDVKRGN